ncbi:MAG: hypothetical protein IKU25_05930 [Clostridia bacterium]|nr:hypothetical protein [Clostridia bacterium]
MKISNILTGIIGGVLLSVPVMYVSYIPYLEFQKNEIHLMLSIFAGALIVAFVLIYKNSSFKFAALRMLAMMFFCYVFIRLLAYTGVLEAINNFLLIHENEASSRVSGLGMVFLFITILCESAIIGIVLLFKEKFWKKSKKGHTGDGSVS